MEDSPEIQLDRLTLGAPAAERDISLGNYFVESDAFKRVQDGSKTIVLGNRGVGKSAIFKMLSARASTSGINIVSLSPEDYSYELLQETMAKEGQGSWAKVGAYAAAWKYLIYVLVMKKLASKGSGLKKGAIGPISKYIRDNHRDSTQSKLTLLVSYLRRIEGVKLGKYEVGLKTRWLDYLYKLEEISELFPSIRDALKGNPVYVFVDELDRGWDASEDAQAFVAGLFQACNSINDLSPKLRVYMSLRQELYDNIPALYDDAQKYRDVIEKVSWNESALLSLISKRIQYNVPVLHGQNEQNSWGAIFSTTLEYRSAKSFNYIVDRTLNRPREIIQFCSDAIEYAARANSGPPIDYTVISDTERKYSEDRTKDIASEYRFQYPGLLSVFEAFRGRVYLFARDDLEYLCLEIISGDVVVVADAAEWLNHLEPERLIDILWRVGFLRARAVGGIKGHRRSGSSYIGPHQIENLGLDNITSFQVHPMFRSYLSLKEPKSKRS